MRLLLDTHVALWAIADDPQLPDRARELITSPDNDVYVSAASIWEIALKHALGRKRMPVSGEEARAYFDAAGYVSVPISADHAANIERLPAIHSDPFDRILVAQALVEPFRLLTHDKTVARYNDSIIFV